MVLLSSTVLLSLVSLVVAFKGDGSLRGRHAHVARACSAGRTAGGTASSAASVTASIPASVTPSGTPSATTSGTSSVTPSGTADVAVNGIASGKPGGKQYQLKDHYKGADFMNEDVWGYFVGNDLTHGLVDYVSHETADSQGMVDVLPNGVAVLSVNNKTDLPLNTPRQSIRITTKKKYNGGLFIADFAAMPFGCATWPAYWSYSVGDWPNGGEIDVLEGVNKQTTNEMTLHTGPGCKLNPKPGSLSGDVLSTMCESSGNSNTGCGISDPDPTSYGQGFNDNGGGVFAHLWDKTGISVWFFARPSIPEDIRSGNPDPSSWPVPVAFWSTESCDVATHFHDHSLVIDTTLCGDWAGNDNVFRSSGCPGTCAETVTKASNFDNAAWMINSISVYDN